MSGVCVRTKGEVKKLIAWLILAEVVEEEAFMLAISIVKVSKVIVKRW